MKITGTNQASRADRPQTTTNGTARSQTAATQPSSGSSSSVQISDMSTRLNQLETQFAAQGGFDEQKVSEIRSAIAEGRYQVNAGAVADKLIASAAQLAGKA